MKKAFFYLPLLFLSCLLAGAQNKPSRGFTINFQDSLQIALENTGNMDARTVGAAFAGVWNKLSVSHQIEIKTQLKLMHAKGYKLRPHFTNYFGAVADAVNLDSADHTTLTTYLSVTDKVIDKESPASANKFFSSSRDFFEHDALNVSRMFRLNLVDDEEYTFDYISNEIIPLPQDTTQSIAADTAWHETPLDTTFVQSNVMMWPTTPPPELSGPVIRFRRVTLNFSTDYDSAFLKDTKGTFSLRDRIFVGEGGSFDWTSTGLGGDSVYYEFSNYFFDTTKPELKGEQGNLVYRGKVAGKVAGQFEFRSTPHKDDKSASYPRFTSFEGTVSLLGLGNDRLKYTGGFSLVGNQINSTSLSGTPSILELMGETDKKFTASSKSFVIKDSLITSKLVFIKIFQGTDSITHPAVSFRFETGRQKLELDKSRSPLKNAPYSATFFSMDFSTDVLKWDIQSDSLDLYTSGGVSQAPMVLESIDYYDPEDYLLLTGRGFSFHPLSMLVRYATKNNLTEVYSADLASANERPLAEVRLAMDFLAQKGMVDFNPLSGLATLKPKAFHFDESAKGITDYDNLKIHSVIDGVPNATINFKNRNMVVRGVEEFKVSDSLNVLIKPDSSVITILQNRDIKFDGKITAGNFEINGKDFTLKYDSFFISLNHIDSIRFYVTEKNAKGQEIRRRVNNSMVGADSAAVAAGGLDASANKTSGTLYINRPDNKAGKLKLPNYPRLDASAGGVIYFDRKEVLNGAYDRSVFFVVPPFKLDSLSDADPSSINFEGMFVSSGMFPPFKEKLHTMSDKSLGFNHSIPAKGYQLFHGEGKITGGVNLDNSGIRAAGRIDYLAAGVESKDFVFYPDSVVARGTIGEIKEKQFGAVWFPQASLPEFKLNWLPKQDRFNITNLRDPFNFYTNTAQLNGQVTVSKTGVTGSGKLITRGSESVSDEMSFSAKNFSARHASFQVKTSNPDKPALAGEDIRLRFDLEKNTAEISPEVEGVAAIEFPYAQFKTSIPTARWDLTNQKIVMTKNPNVPIENSYFYSTREELDSLSFNASQAEYDIKNQQLKVSGIPFITVADAMITPENNEVLILENAKIGQLKNTTIVIDTLNGFHHLTEGVVDIISRKEFQGYATYQYVNALSDTFAIKMTDFHLEAIAETGRSRRLSQGGPTQQTVAKGAVEEKSNLVLAPRIFYKGDMVMYATRPALELKGFAKLDLKKIKNYNTWLVYEQSGDEKEVFLDFDNSVTEDGRKAEAGLHWAVDNTMYITFVSDKTNPEDDDFFLPSGSLYFDTASHEFKIEDRRKAAGEKLSGKVFAYNEEKQEVRFEGMVNFFQPQKDFTISASAIGSGNLETNEIRMNSLVVADINIPGLAYQMMAQSLQAVIKNENVSEGRGDATELLYKVANMVGEKVAKDFESRSLQSYVSLGTVQGLVKPIVLADADIKWSEKFKAFYNTGTLGMSNMGKYDINGAFEGFMEIRKNEDGSPVFNLFIKASPEVWYYFGFEDNRLLVHSSTITFNELIAKKTNASKAKGGDLIFIPGSDEETLAFIQRFRLNYLGLDAPYELSGASATNKKEKKKGEKDEDDGF